MANKALSAAYSQIMKAAGPSVIFGKAKNEEELNKVWRTLAKLTHEDRYEGKDKDLAREAFKRLNEFHELALSALRGGFSSSKDEGSFSIGDKLCNLTGSLKSSGICDIKLGILGDKPVFVKVARDPKNNDLLKNEADILAKLTAHEAHLKDYLKRIPNLLHSVDLRINDKRHRANVFSYVSDSWNLEEVLQEYPEGIPGRAAAWMFNRVGWVLSEVHAANIVHGSLLPCHILIRPADHFGMPVNFCYAVEDSNIKAIVPRYRDFYPPEVFEKEKATFETDCFMLGKTFSRLLVRDKSEDVRTLRAFFDSLCYQDPALRPDDLSEVMSDFKNTLLRCYGPPQWHEFVMPKPTV